jgi:uncharacterized protein (DUF4415 family)
MNDAPTGNISTEPPKTDWDRLRRLTPEEIRAGLADDPSAAPTDPGFWDTAHVVQPRPKETVTMRLDADVLDWFREQGRGYQTRMNAVLRSFVENRRHGLK